MSPDDGRTYLDADARTRSYYHGVGFLSLNEVESPLANRHYLAPLHLWSADFNAIQCGQIEADAEGAGPDFLIRHRTHAVSAILSSAAFLEALVNEVLQDAVDSTAFNVASDVVDFDAKTLRRLATFWTETSRAGKYVSTLDKLNMVLVLIGRNEFDKGVRPYQDVQAVVKLRNKLVHYQPRSQLASEEHVLKKYLTGRFETKFTCKRTGRLVPNSMSRRRLRSMGSRLKQTTCRQLG